MPIDKRPSPFTAEDYRPRLARLRAELGARGADAMLVTSASNICYLSGYGAASSYVAQALVVFADEEAPFLVVRRQDAPAAMHMAYFANDRVVGYPERFVGDHQVTGFDFLFDWLKSRPGVKTVAMEFDSVSAATLDTIRSRQSHLRLVDLSDVVVEHRLVKSPKEIAVMREASIITDYAMHEGIAAFRAPGAREVDVAAAFTAALMRGTEGLWGDRGEFITMPGGQQSGTSHLNWSGDLIQAGRHYNPEIGGFRYRYAVGLMRTIVVGKPSEKLARLHDYTVEGCNEALARVRPGATTGEVSRAFCDTVTKGGYTKESRCGYPIGIDWLETSCSLRTDDPTVLSPGMVFHLMLGMWVEEDFGLVLSETFAVTDTGCEVFSQVPRQLFVI